LAEVTLPSLGESVTEGIITQWFKKIGDVVARDEALFEVSTDKVDSEMPSPATGVLTQILAAEGDTVQTGAVVCIIDESADASAVAPTGAAPAPTPATATVSLTPPQSVDGTVTNGLILSPVVRRILADGEVDPSTVTGTGKGGVITRRDAERAVALGPTEEIVLAQSNGHRRMGAYLSVSAQVVPHGFVAVEVDASFAATLDAAGRITEEGFTLTDEVVVAMAAVRSLRDFPALNAYYLDNEIVLQRSINIGFTRHEVDDAMLVPVVHAAASLSTALLARRVSELDARNAARQLNADDLMGATFSVARAPSANTLTHQPIIVQPQVAVLSIGAVRTVPVVVDRDGTPAIAVGQRVVLGLSFDHRVCDGVVAAAFVERVGALLDDVAAER